MKNKEDYTLIYDQLDNRNYDIVGLCKKGELKDYVHKRFEEIGYDCVIFNHTIIIKKDLNNEELSKFNIYVYEDLDKLDKLDQFADKSVEDIEDILFQKDLKNIKEKRKKPTSIGYSGGRRYPYNVQPGIF